MIPISRSALVILRPGVTLLYFSPVTLVILCLSPVTHSWVEERHSSSETVH